MKCTIMIYKSSKILQIFDFLNYVSHNMIQDIEYCLNQIFSINN